MGALTVVAAADPHLEQRALAMLHAAPHRGTTVRATLGGGVALAVSTAAEAPDAWVACRNGTSAAFVGELDNRSELDAELVRLGARRPKDPAETVLAAFTAWGDNAPEKLRGRFAGAFSENGTLRCFRDQLGLRTLYYRSEPDAFYAATEPKQVAAGAHIERRASLDALEAIFYGRLGERETAVGGVERFPRASVSTRDADGKVAFRRYWHPEKLLETARFSQDDARERLAELLEQAIARSLTGNDAVSLSGGVDSTTIAAVAAPQHEAASGRPLTAVSAVYPDHPSVDERRWIELVTARLGLPLHAYVPRARPLDDVQRWVDLLDGPVETVSIPEIAENYEAARALGVHNVLTGELAEYVVSMRQHLLAHLLLHGRWQAAGRGLRHERARGTAWRLILRALAPSLAPPLVARAYFGLRRRPQGGVPPWVDAPRLGKPWRQRDLARPARARWLEAQLDPLRGAAVTLEADEICAAACGVSVRRPLADVDLWEFFLSLPAEVKFPDAVPKRLLRETMRGRLPDEILDRRDKTAFDEHALAAADYNGLRRWTVQSELRVPGVDYALLRERLDRTDLGVLELMWAYDLARVHAFAEACA